MVMSRLMKRISVFAFFLSLTSVLFSKVIVTYEDDNSRELLSIGLAYYIGQNGYKRDYAKAYEYLKQAADLNNADAQAVIGIMYENGYGRSLDYVKAAEWYQKAAAQDQSNAQNSLGLLYLNGLGVEKDQEQALYWFKKALANGNKSAEDYVVMLESGSKKIALVIGNANYPKGKLATPINDAQSISDRLLSLGFEVIVKTNLELQGMNQVMDEFCQKATGYDAALFYFAGYAVQVEGINYLIPAKSYIEPSTVMYDCFNMSRFMAKLDAANVDKKIIILDACRDNSQLVRDKGSIKQGLARISQYGYFNVLSAQADKTVTDAKGEKISVFTREFLNGMTQPNVPLYQMFKDIQSNVSNKTNNEQIPSINDDLVGSFYFNASKTATSNLTNSSARNTTQNVSSGVTQKTNNKKNKKLNYYTLPEFIESVQQEDDEQIVVFSPSEAMELLPGGSAGYQDYLRSNLSYPMDCRENGIQGRVTVIFIIEKDGSITNVGVLGEGAHSSLDAEAVRMISKMPKLKEPKRDGKPVRVAATLPINFRLK